jgi:hypothetical protein
MKFHHVLSVRALVVAIVLFLVNKPTAAFMALLGGTVVELIGAALTGKKRNI